jgi:hypothetical protein
MTPLCLVSDRLKGGTHRHLNFDTFGYRDGAVNGRDGYQRKALECARAAERLRDAGERKKLLQIAALYMSLTRRVADRRDRADDSRRSHKLHPEDA